LRRKYGIVERQAIVYLSVQTNVAYLLFKQRAEAEYFGISLYIAQAFFKGSGFVC